MRNILTLLLLFVFTAGFAQNKNGYSISGQLKGAGNVKVYLRDISFYKAEHSKDSVLADKDGKFAFKGVVDEPSYYDIQVKDKPGSLGLILENAKISIIGNADSIWLATLTGSKENEVNKLAATFVADTTFKKMFSNVEQAIEQARQKNDLGALTSALAQKEKAINSDVMRIKKFIARYPATVSGTNMISLLIMYNKIDDADSLLQLVEKYGSNGQTDFFRSEISKLKDLASGKIAPEFSQADTSGKQIALSSYKGRYVLIDFWASWCGQCREQSPKLRELNEKFKSNKFTIISVSLDKDALNWKKAILSDKMDWVHTSDLKGWDNDAAKKYAVDYIPQNYLISPDGVIIAANLNEFQLAEKLNELLR